ncbi:3',5'-cyclic-AMP phosphodiesterase [Thalassolituus marinus]|uniref:3',5'-cyclic-AMP phosphodiesterase n=1 Tax=Thalassolituus marinus TaxID=671053 RepID=A0ABS7ZRK0_9GAMM|nr:3',5'-cyclic-AMP phosphodiesterase [Thalassolituus marinus]MCA6063873.1 3',5'-cyclic-AMP phosphodiesterase [Thalassolituus marinus]
MYSLESGNTLRLVQITDTHLNGPEDGHLLGMKTLHSMNCVLDIVREERSDIDAILVTGDLSQDGTEQAYQHLHNALTPFECPVFWFEGNHDNPQTMRSVAAGTEHLNQIIRSEHWQVVLLNSQVEGAVYGRLSVAQLELLEQALQERPDLHTLISFHHHPIPMGSTWIDRIGVKNSDEFMSLIARFGNVKCVLWGHVHQESDQMINGVRFLSTPSTCVQFTPNSEDFSVDTVAPGYRWLDLQQDGAIDTGISRVEGIEFEIDYSVKGY